MIKNEVLKSFYGKNVVVTGGTGLIGRQVVALLVDWGAHVKIISLDKNIVHDNAEHVYGDLCGIDFCRKVTAKADYVFHLAGIKGSVDVTRQKPASFFIPLLMMNTNLLEAARFNEVEKLVYTSSIGAYSSAEVFRETENLDGVPMDAFPGLAKRVAEKQIEAYAIQYGMKNFSIVRPANVYGIGDNFDPNNAMVIPSLMSRIHKGEDPVIVWGDGSAIRDFAYSEDIAKGIILALHHGTNGKFVNLGSGKGYSIKELVETLARVVGFNYKFDTTKSSGFPKRVMDISLASELLGYIPEVSLEDGLRRTWLWFKAHSTEHLKKQNYFRNE
jgi:GDP-L-fucose synthase